ncbi:MAG: serine hydrolase [Alteromonadaceae bacterium]|nr:serine hydrolase [Alteromonadaceae bacterium]
MLLLGVAMLSIKRILVAICVLLPCVAMADESSIHDPRIVAFERALIDLYKRSDNDPKRWGIEQRMAHYNIPGMALAIIENNQVIWAAGYGNRMAKSATPVDTSTLFSVGSVSKMVNAALILKLVEEGTLALNRDVNRYLTSWQIPPSRHTRKNKVTLSQILSHTAGFNVHGFADFMPGQELPSIIDTLNGDYPARHGRVRVVFTPGSEMDYSGGGIQVSQLIATDMKKQTYEQLAQSYVFQPLGMSRSTFQNPLPATMGNIANAHDDDGEPSAKPRGWEAMPEMAASGLWTTADDLAKFVIALLDTYQAKSDYYSQATIQQMMRRQPNSWYGLGPRLNGSGESLVFHHGGANQSYRAWIEGHLNTGNGIVILTNGTNGHLLNRELRNAAEDIFGWAVNAKSGLAEPD